MSYHPSKDFGDAVQTRPWFVESVRAVAVAADGSWYLAGDREIQARSRTGQLMARWPISLPAWSLAVDPEGQIWAGQQGQIEVYASDGHLLDTWQNAELFGLVTALWVGESVLVADARSRWIHRFDPDRGFSNHIGDQHRKGGFHIPNGVLDFGVDLDGTVVVANPGMHRVERYRPDGEYLGHFGQFGQQDPASFPGCCNPTNLAVGPNGEIVVSEKADPRVKVYDSDGQLLTVVASREYFDPGCKNMDLAVTPEGRIGVVDTVLRRLEVFVRTESSAVTPATVGTMS